MSDFSHLKLVDSETGEDVSVSRAEWAQICKLANDPDDTLASLPNSSAPIDNELSKFFADLLKTLTDAIGADARTDARAAAASADKEVYNPKTQLSQAMADALDKLSKLTPAQLKVAKALGPLFSAEGQEEKVRKNLRKAQLTDMPEGQSTEEDLATLSDRLGESARRTFRKNSVTLK